MMPRTGRRLVRRFHIVLPSGVVWDRLRKKLVVRGQWSPPRTTGRAGAGMGSYRPAGPGKATGGWSR